MADLFLIAHKVRGEPAFDIAERMRCPNCQGVGGHNIPDFETGIVSDYEGSDCGECDGLGYWWIIGTSGHRAYPYWHGSLKEVYWSGQFGEIADDLNYPVADMPLFMPPDLPDHYPTRSSPKAEPSSGKKLLAALGLIPKVVRRL